MRYGKKLIITSAIVGSAGLAGIGATAMAATSSNSGGYPSIVQRIASTFGLDPAKVNAVFQQQHQDNQAARQAKLKTTLDQAVKDGKLTQDQEDKLIAEINTLHSQLKADTKADRRQDRRDLRAQLERWAKDNGIANLNQILPAHHGMMVDNDGDSDDSGAPAATN